MSDDKKSLVGITQKAVTRKQTSELSKAGSIFEMINLLPEDEKRAIMVEIVKSKLELDKGKEISQLAMDDLEELVKIAENANITFKSEGEIKTASGRFKVKIRKGGLW